MAYEFDWSVIPEALPFLAQGMLVSLALLASVIIGLSLFKGFRRIRPTTAVVFGSVAYKACLSIALALGLPTEYLKLLMAALFVLALIAGEKPLVKPLFKRRQSHAA